MLTMIISLFTSLYFYVNPISAAGGSGWDYDEAINVSQWASAYPECGGLQQSPIDVIFDEDSSICDEVLLLDWLGSDETGHFAIRNTGKSIQAIPFEINNQGGGDLSGLEVLHHTNDTLIRLPNQFYHTFKSPVNKEYCFDSLHFHWGRNNEEGSEHTLNGVAYPLEVHFVHYSCDYYLAGTAIDDYVDGSVLEQYDDQHVLAVIGVVFEIGAPNPVLEQILDETIYSGVYEYHDPEEAFGEHLLELYYADINMSGLIPDNKEYIAYKGSLTTPPCLETVRWHVMKTPMTVSLEQMEAFRGMLESMNQTDLMAPNYRPVQPLNNRTIYQCLETVEAETVTKDVVEVSDPESELEEAQKSADTWFIVAIIFIILFGLSLMGMIYLYYIAFAKKRDQPENDREHKYKKTSTASTASIGNNEEMEEITR